jgi:formate hydrogenlyase subunit 3/multisubunit Na+/H+ antiporter MnhD subunit
LFLILGWGYQPERVQAGIYLLFYTLLASLPLLVGILFIYNSLGSLCLFLLSGNENLVGHFPPFHTAGVNSLLCAKVSSCWQYRKG